MITFGGSPIPVADPPTLENSTSAISTFFGSRFNTSHSLEKKIFNMGFMKDQIVPPIIGLITNSYKMFGFFKI